MSRRAVLAHALVDPEDPPPAGPGDATAKSLREAFGMNIHIDYMPGGFKAGTPPAQDYNRCADLMAECGVHWVRAPIWPTNGAYSARLQYTTDLGIKLVVMAPTTEQDDGSGGITTQWLDACVSMYPGDVVGFEWPNEYNNRGMGGGAGQTGWPDRLVVQGKRLRDGRNARPSLASFPIMGPSILHWLDANGDPNGDGIGWQLVADQWNSRNGQYPAQGWGNASTAYDIGNTHPYPGEDHPQDWWLGVESNRVVAAGLPSYRMGSTEWGWHTAPLYAQGVPESIQAVYSLRYFMVQWWNWGPPAGKPVPCFFAPYQFADDGTGSTDGVDNYGFIHTNFTKKPVHDAFKNFTTILGAKTNPTVPAVLTYTFEGAVAGDMRHCVVQRADNKHVIIVWREVQVWDYNTDTVITPIDSWHQIRSPGVTSVQVYNPVVSAAPTTLDADGSGGLWVDLRGGNLLMLVVG